MSANPCGCDPEAGHECTTHRIQHLEELVQVLQDDLAETRKAPAPCVWRAEKAGGFVFPRCSQRFGQSPLEIAGWKFCPYCGSPLKVER